MVYIGKMRMTVLDRCVLMRMAVWLGTVPLKAMRMLVVLIVCMAMAVCEGIMLMLVRMMFHQMNPHPDGHQGGSEQEHQRDRLAQDQDRDNRAKKGRRGKIGASARAAKPAQSQHKQYQTHAIPKQPNHHD